MKIQYLGTGAAEGIPAVFCDCARCKRSKELGGRNIRTRSQALVDDTILVDFPPDTYLHYLRFNFPITKIKTCIVTHSHADHLYPADIEMRNKNYCANIGKLDPLSFYGDKSVYDKINDVIKHSGLEKNEVQNNLIKVNTPFTADGYTIIPLRAAHGPESTPVVYIIEKDGKSLFYSNDTSDYPEESWEYLRKYNKPIDLISLDCTAALSHIEYIGHMSLERNIAIREKLFDAGAADEHTVFVLNHFSHNGEGVVYDDFVNAAEKEGFVVAYDGMVIEF